METHGPVGVRSVCEGARSPGAATSPPRKFASWGPLPSGRTWKLLTPCRKHILREAEELKTESLAAMMGVGFGLGIVFFIAGGLCLLRYHRLFRRARAADEVCAADGVLEAPVKSPESAIIAPAPAEAWDAQECEAHGPGEADGGREGAKLPSRCRQIADSMPSTRPGKSTPEFD